MIKILLAVQLIVAPSNNWIVPLPPVPQPSLQWMFYSTYKPPLNVMYHDYFAPQPVLPLMMYRDEVSVYRTTYYTLPRYNSIQTPCYCEDRLQNTRRNSERLLLDDWRTPVRRDYFQADELTTYRRWR